MSPQVKPLKIETFQDIIRILRERPEWLEEMRRLILTDELLALPKRFDTFLKEEFYPLRQDVETLKQDVAVLKQDVAELKGNEFERRVRERAPAYLGKLVRRCKTLSFEELAELLEDAVEKGLISDDEKAEVLNLDAVAGGISKADGRRCFLALEVSVKVDIEDVERAARRASVLARAGGFPAIGVVVGREIAERASLRAEELGVVAV